MNANFMQQLLAALGAGGQGIPNNPMYSGQGQMPPQAFGAQMPTMPQTPMTPTMPTLPTQANPIAGQAMGGGYSPTMPTQAQPNYGMGANPMAMQNANPMGRFRR